MKEKGWALRWENSQISPGHIWNCIHNLGWEYVTPDEIACTLEEAGAAAQDNRIVRGMRGEEVLLKMRETDKRRIAMRKAQENTEITFNTQKTQSAALNAVGSEFGEQAASFVRKANINITDSREAMSPDE
jgi:hypothetical protein